jgi:hypothetical protein
MDLPFAVVAIPAVSATLLCSLTGRLTQRWWLRMVLVGVIVIIGAAVTAGVVSQFSVHGSFGAVAYRPWTVAGRVPSETAALAWFVASVAWARGAWLALQKVSFRHACGSAVISTCAFVILFAVLATNHQPALHVATANAAALFLLCFFGAIAVLALLRQRDLESEALHRAPSRPSGVWLTVLAIPMLAVSAIALAVATGAGPVAPVVGRAFERAIVAVAGAIDALVRLIGRIVPGGHPTHTSGTTSHSRVASQPFGFRPITTHTEAHVPEFVSIIVGVLIVALLAFVVLRGVRWLSLRRNPSATPPMDEVRESVFSWRHFWDQFRALIMKLVGRRGRPPSREGTELTTAFAASAPGVRAEYRRFLHETGRASVPRNPQETTREFARRLQSLPSIRSAGQTFSVRQLTHLYDGVRYGGLEDNEHDGERAQLLVDQVMSPLMAMVEHSEPDGRSAGDPDAAQPGPG